MKYESVKKQIGKIIGASVFLRKVFYKLLNILLLRTWHVHKELKHFFKKNKNSVNISVLDAGSGFGQYSYYIAKKKPVWKIESIDINANDINDCKAFLKNAGINNVVCKLADLTSYINPSEYDLILSVDVMEHIENDELVFNNFFKSLKNGGLLIISTPSNLGGSDVINNNDSSFIDEHVREGYSKEDISSKLKKAGFKIQDIYYTYGKYGKLSWRLSMKYPLLLGKNKWLLPVLVFYYVIIMPFCLLLNYADLQTKNKTGTGLIIKAYK